jgi:predicted ABC-type ATPase
MDHVINQTQADKIQISYANIPLAVFLLGANGSGKSTLRNYLNLSDIQTNIDPDVLNRIFKPRYPNSYLIEAAKQALTMYNQGISNGLNICIESTLSGRGTMERIKAAKANRYFVIAYLVGLNSLSLNIERVRQRVLKGGHDIPESTITRRYTESINNFLTCCHLFDEVHIIDNSQDAYNLQLSKTPDKLIRHTELLEPWVNDIMRKL